MTKSAGAASSPLTVTSGENTGSHSVSSSSSSSSSSSESSSSDSEDDSSRAARPKSPSRHHHHSHRKDAAPTRSARRSPKSPRPAPAEKKEEQEKKQEKPAPQRQEKPEQQKQEKKEEEEENVLESKEYQTRRTEFVERWNARQYDACLEAIGACVALLGARVAAARAAQRTPEPAVVRELSLVVAYRVAVAILKDIIRLSAAGDAKNGATVALRAKFLAELPLHGPHRIDCIRLAIDKNMAAHNYGVACRLLQVLLQHRLPDSKALQDKYDVCAAHKWADESLPPYTCPGCHQRASPASTECACDMPIKFCCRTFALLQDRVVSYCALCKAIYAQAAVPVGERCPLCGCAPVDAFDIYAEVQRRKEQRQDAV